jgi:hypothetical protein
MDGYALRDGAHHSPAMATTAGGTPLWHPGEEGAFLAHRPGIDPARWPRGRAGEALDRFVRDLLPRATAPPASASSGSTRNPTRTTAACRRSPSMPPRSAATWR